MKDVVVAMLPHSKAEASTDAVAVGALTSPLWLHDLAGWATDLLPILGVTWLLVQITMKLYVFCRR